MMYRFWYRMAVANLNFLITADSGGLLAVPEAAVIWVKTVLYLTVLARQGMGSSMWLDDVLPALIQDAAKMLSLRKHSVEDASLLVCLTVRGCWGYQPAYEQTMRNQIRLAEASLHRTRG